MPGSVPPPLVRHRLTGVRLVAGALDAREGERRKNVRRNHSLPLLCFWWRVPSYVSAVEEAVCVPGLRAHGIGRRILHPMSLSEVPAHELAGAALPQRGRFAPPAGEFSRAGMRRAPCVDARTSSWPIGMSFADSGGLASCRQVGEQERPASAAVRVVTVDAGLLSRRRMLQQLRRLLMAGEADLRLRHG